MVLRTLTRCLLLQLLAFMVSESSKGDVHAPAPEGIAFFEKKIRPLLVERCYECHSAQSKKVKGGLLLDTRGGLLKGGDNGPAIVPGQPEKSLLITAVSYKDPDLEMPPKNKLTETEVSALREWIQMGAPDPRVSGTPLADARQTGLSVEEGRKFWAYLAPKKTPPPEVKEKAWVRTDVDRFILAALEAKGLPPAADADRTTLIRRIYFDLIGLPPAPEQIDAFVNDARPDALERLVEQLLASGHFGEHWGRHWLDVVRFAESVTLRGMIFKEAWRYRDYVIDAFNRDLPYDQFIREQVAGDLLSGSTLEGRQRQRIATTFLALGPTNFEEQDKKLLRMDVVDEQLDTIGKAFLGQTIGCARCHDHKFDPIPTRDYYAMAGILRNTRTMTHANVSSWIEVPLPVASDQEKIFQEHELAVTNLQAELKLLKENAKALAGKSAEPRDRAGKASVVAARDLAGTVVDSAQAKAVGEWKHSQYSKHYVGEGYWHDDNKGKGEKTLTFVPELPRPGRYEVRLAYIHSPSRAADVPVTVFHADGETLVHVNQQEAPVIEGRFVSLGQFRFEQNGFGHVLVANEGTRGHVTADAVQFVSAETIELANPAGDKTGSGPARKRLETAAAVPTTNRLAAQIKTLEEKLKKLQESGPKRAMAMSVQEENEIADTEIHIRGSVERLGETVPRGFLTVATAGHMPVLSREESGRKELAEWLASPSNPLAARVMVNRIWCWLTGEGIVRTTENFGATGEKPSHPELLDFLAIQFMEQGWSVKKLVREIVLSRTYQLSSAARTSAATTDPENRLLWRMNRRRLNAECIRDAILSVSGQLDLAAGGVTYPKDLAADYNFQFTAPRRSVYVPVFRNAMPEIFDVFDFASPNMVTGRRNVSTVPTQALFLMNHPFAAEQAGHAARRLLGIGGLTDGARVDLAYRLALGRLPTEAERKLALAHVGSSDAIQQPQVWTELFHALFACVDFRYLN